MSGLFEMTPTPVELVPKLSAGRALTIRQARDIARGSHPLGYLGAIRHSATIGEQYARDDKAGRKFTCGSCRFRAMQRVGAKSYAKCMVGGRDRGSAASDVRGWWPGCRQWEAVQ